MADTERIDPAGGRPRGPTRTGPDAEETHPDVARVWEQSVPGHDLDALDLEATFRPRALSGSDSGGAKPGPALRMPTFSVFEPHAPASDPDSGAESGGERTASTETTTFAPAEVDAAAARIADTMKTTPADAIPLPGAVVPGRGPGSASSPGETEKTLAPDVGDEPTVALGGMSRAPRRADSQALMRPREEALFELVEPIGSGGMGVVYRARQRSLERDIAIKKLHAGHRELENKFQAEALITGRLDHPNIVPVYDLGTSMRGESLLAMKLVEGVSWKRLLRPEKEEDRARADELDLADHLQILLAVCNAVAFAHSRGIAHCDLKPENVMVGEFGEVLVMDWGLALDIRDEPPADLAGSRVTHKSQLQSTPFGTPAYMAPEQAWGNGEKVGPWTDVYLLGATLHDVITRSPPHSGGPAAAVLWRAAQSEPHDYGPEIPPDLSSICHRAMAREPEDRHGSVGDFADAVRLYLEHRESRKIAAAARERLAGCRERAGREGLPPLEESERTALYAELAETVGAFGQARLLWEDNDDAAEGERAARLVYAETALAQGDLGLAEAQLAPVEGARPEAAALRERIDRTREAKARAERNARLQRALLVAALALIFVGLSVGITLVNRERGRALRSEANAREQRDLAEQARGTAERRLATSLVAQGDMLGASGRLAEARARFTDALGILAANDMSTLPAELGLWAVERGGASPLLVLAGHEKRVRAVAFSPDGRRLYSVSEDGTLRAWETITGLPLFRIETGQGGATDVAVAPDGERVATAGADGSVKLWDPDDGRALGVLAGHEGPVSALDFEPDGLKVVSGGADGSVRVWDAVGATALHEMKERHTAPVTAATQSSGGGYTFTVDERGGMRWWNTEPGSVHWGWEEGTLAPATSIAFAPRVAELAIGCADGSVRIWAHETVYTPEEKPDPNSRMPPRRRQLLRNNYYEITRLLGHAGRVETVAFSPDARFVISGGVDGRLIVWRVELRKDDDTGKLSAVTERTLTTTDHVGAVLDVAVSPRGEWVASAGRDGTIRLWYLGVTRFEGDPGSTRMAVRPLPAPERLEGQREAPGVRAVAISPDGRLAATGRADGRVQLFDAATTRRLATLEGLKAPVTRLAFLGGGAELLTASADGRVRVWSVAELQPVRWIESPPDAEGAAAVGISETADRVVIAGEQSARVHALAGGPPRLSLRGDAAAAPSAAAITADARTALLAGPDPLVRLWDLAGERPAGVLRGHEAGVGAVAVDPSGRIAATGDADGAIRLWDLPGREPIRVLAGHTDAVTRLRFSPDGELLYSSSKDASWRIWSVARGAEVRALADEHRAPLGDVAVSADGATAITGDGEGEARIWYFGRSREQRALAGELAGARRALAEAAAGAAPPAAALAVLGRWYAFHGAWKQAIELLVRARAAGEPVAATLLARCFWEVDHHLAALDALESAAHDEAPAGYLAVVGRRLRELESTEGSRVGREPDIVAGMAYAPDGSVLVTSSHQGTLSVWEPRTGILRRGWSAHPREIYAVAVSPDGARIASGGRGGEVRVWDAATGRLHRTLPPAQGSSTTIRELIYHPDGSLLVVTGEAIGLWDAERGALVRSFAGPSRPPEVALSPDGARLAAGTSEQLHVLEVATGARGLAIEEDARAEKIVFADADRMLVSGRELRLIDAVSGEVEKTIETSTSIYGLDVSADGRLIVVSGIAMDAMREGETRLLDLETGDGIAWWRGGWPVLVARFAPDGRTVATAARDGRIRLHAVPEEGR